MKPGLTLASGAVRCDATGCPESHPRHHADEGKSGFVDGRWPGWLYLDINRTDVVDRLLGFCSVWCLRWWLEHATAMQRAAAPTDNAEIDADAARMATR